MDPVDQDPEAQTSSCKDSSHSKCPSVSLVNGAVFAHLLRSGCELFTLSVSQIKELAEVSTASADTNHEDKDPGLDLLPEEYKEFADIFSRKEADKLPEHRHYDHRIPIPEDSMPPFGPMYRHSPVELEAL
jgi:hypothetical protein